MKKIWFLFLNILVIWGSVSFAYSDLTNDFIRSFESKMQSMTAEKKHNYLEQIATLLTSPQIKNHSNPQLQQLVKELQQRINPQLGLPPLNDQPSDHFKSSDGTSYQDIANVDFEKVRNQRVERHNSLRKNRNLQNYTYHSDLEKTAKNWSNHLASIKKRTHKRNEKDGFYNYNSIKERFWGLGVKFPAEQQRKSAFSESIGYRGYTCTQGDCTQAVLKVSKKIFDTFAAEGEKGAHYKAMVMPHFKHIGVWFQFEPQQKYLYVVIHYAGDMLE